MLGLLFYVYNVITLSRIFSARLPQLVSIILEAGIADGLTEDYAACLEARSQEIQAPESLKEDIGVLILQVKGCL